MKTLFTVLLFGFALWFWGSIIYAAKKESEKRTEEAKKRAEEAKQRAEEDKKRAAEEDKKWAEKCKKRLQDEHLKKIHDYRDSLVSRVLKTFGQEGLNAIPKEDIDRHCLAFVDHRKSDNDTWKSVWDTITHNCKVDARSKANREKAQKIGERLIAYKDSLVKRQAKVLDTAELETILNDTSSASLAAEHELVLAWRVYTIEREQQICRGQLHVGSTQEEIKSARLFRQSRAIIFDVSNPEGVSKIKAQITSVLANDILSDDVKWSAREAADEALKARLRVQYYGSKPPPIPLNEPDPARDEYAESNLRWMNNKQQYQFNKHYGSVIDNAIVEMLNEHRDYWIKHPDDPYDDRALQHIFDFSVYGGNYGLGSLFILWRRYMELRTLFGHSEDKEYNSDANRNLPIKWPHSHPNARDIVEAHIRKVIREDILTDIANNVRSEKEAIQRREEYRRKRSHELRDEFIRKIRGLYGQSILEMIAQVDIENYCLEILDHRKSQEDAWFSVLAKYDFDGNTRSCLYFIRQGDAIKIGITDSLERRFAQIKTSASDACKIESVVYTHHGRRMEQKLHKALAPYNTHLEWFQLPTEIENMLFAAKTINELERVLRDINKGKGDVI